MQVNMAQINKIMFTLYNYLTLILLISIWLARRGRLRLPTSSLLDVRPSRLVTVGDRSFATAGQRLWNSLPVDVQSAP